jgi:hypothetical protein
MRALAVLASVASLCASSAAAAPAAAHIQVAQHPDQRGDPLRYVARAQRCKDEFFKELRLADGRAPGPAWAHAPPTGAAPNPAIRQLLDEGGLPAAQVLAAAINVCLEAQGLWGVRAAPTTAPLPRPPLE